MEIIDRLVTEFAQQSNLYVDELRIDDFHIDGSSRLGVYEANRTISRRVARDLNNDNQISNNEYVVETPEEVLYLYSSYQLERGAKRYELSNHLGNVLTVISDKKTANFTGATFTQFTADRISATDYSPFGAPLAGRTWNGGEYRYGFNSMVKDNEFNGTGNAYDFGARIYDARLGRWMSVDPLQWNYPYVSSFVFALNKPLSFVDGDGMKVIPSNHFVGSAYHSIILKITNDPSQSMIAFNLIAPFLGNQKNLYLQYHPFSQDEDTKAYRSYKISSEIPAVRSDRWARNNKKSEVISFNSEAVFRHSFNLDNTMIMDQNGDWPGNQMTEIGMFQTVVHELLHANGMSHETMAMSGNRALISKAILQYASKNNINITPEQAADLAWNGLNNSENSSWTALSIAEQNRINTEISNLFYGKLESESNSEWTDRMRDTDYSTETKPEPDR